jgi:hypothetical protein
MTSLEKLSRTVKRWYPALDIDLDRGTHGKGWLNIRLPGLLCVVFHRPTQGYSVAALEQPSAWTGYGENSGHPLTNYGSTERYVKRLLAKRLGRPARAGSTRKPIPA